MAAQLFESFPLAPAETVPSEATVVLELVPEGTADFSARPAAASKRRAADLPESEWKLLPSMMVRSAGRGPDADPLAWQEQGLCAQIDPDAFFPERGEPTRDPKKMCGNCEVRTECLDFALTHDVQHGIWGGLTERERRRLKRQAG